MGKQFLDGYIGLAEGEKDPRNLMVAFAIARVILIEFDVTLHVEVREEACLIPLVFTDVRRNLIDAVNFQHIVLLLPDNFPTTAQ